MKGRRPAELDDPDRKPRSSINVTKAEWDQLLRDQYACDNTIAPLPDNIVDAILDARRLIEEQDQRILDQLRNSEERADRIMRAIEEAEDRELDGLEGRASLRCATCHQQPYECHCLQADGIPWDEGWEG